MQLLLAAKATAEAAARDAEEAAAVEAAAQEAVVTAALMYDAAVADAQLAEEPAGVAEAAAIKAAPPLPSNLKAALDALDSSQALRAGLTDAFVDSYLKLRRAHWDEYARHLSPWEIEAYFDV